MLSTSSFKRQTSRAPGRRWCMTLVVVLATLVAGLADPAWAQSTSGSIRGRVADESDAVVPGATVMATNVGTGIQRTTVTDASGRYSLFGLVATTYELKVELSGFATRTRTVELAVSQTLEIPFTLTVAGLESTVQVTGEVPIVNTATTELGGRMDPKSLTELPINGRDYARFSLLVPGAIAKSNYIADLAFNGLHGVHNSFQIDGVDASRVDQPYMANGFERGARLLTGSLDSVQEFRVNTGMYQAEFGRSSGSYINVISKSGSNTLHGAAFEFLRHSRFDRPNYFQPAGSSKPLYKLNQFGGNLGGPIRRNATFFFVNYEGSRQTLGITGTGTVPSQALRARVLSTSPALRGLLETYPLGTSPTANPYVDNVTLVKSSDVREDTGSVKIDHRFSDKDSFFVRTNVNDTKVVGALFGVFATALATDQFQVVPVRTTNVAMQEQHIFGGAAVNEFRVGMQRWDSKIISDTPYPNTTVFGMTAVAGTNGRSALVGTMYQFTDNFSFSRGNHAFKAGFDYRYIPIDNSSINRQSMTYASLDDFANNSVSSATLTPGNPGHTTIGKNYGAYFQDDFKPLNNLTLNLGVRYEYYAPVYDKANLNVSYSTKLGQLAPAGTDYYTPDRNNFAPRFGVVWSPDASARWVVRGGVGMYYQAYPTGFGAYSIPLNDIAGATTLLRSQVPNLSFPLEPFVAAGTAPLRTVAGFDLNRKDIYTEQWTVNVQRELGRTMMVQVAYVGNRGHNLRRNMNVNFFDPALGRRPNPLFADINIEGNTGKSRYHGLQLSFKRRLADGLSFDFEYTFGNAMDDVQDQTIWSGQPQDNRNLEAEWGRGSGDVRHNLVFHVLYELPFGPGHRFGGNASGLLGFLIGGWQINTLGMIHTGVPFTVELGGNSFGNFNFTNQRPDVVPGVSTKPANRTITNWLNPAAFANPAPGTFGNLGRNTEVGPGFAQIDLSIFKTQRVREGHTLQLRAEVFNLLNRANFANPVAQYRNTATFGKVLNTLGRTIGMGTSLQIQFAIKYLF